MGVSQSKRAPASQTTDSAPVESTESAASSRSDTHTNARKRPADAGLVVTPQRDKRRKLGEAGGSPAYSSPDTSVPDAPKRKRQIDDVFEDASAAAEELHTKKKRTETQQCDGRAAPSHEITARSVAQTRNMKTKRPGFILVEGSAVALQHMQRIEGARVVGNQGSGPLPADVCRMIKLSFLGPAMGKHRPPQYNTEGEASGYPIPEVQKVRQILQERSGTRSDRKRRPRAHSSQDGKSDQGQVRIDREGLGYMACRAGKVQKLEGLWRSEGPGFP